MAMNKRIYIQTAKQISIQQPLSEEWMTNPAMYDGGMAHAIEANYRNYLSSIEARRMAPIMKRALATAMETIRQTEIEHPDAIITGTSIGSLEYTEKFLDALTENGERLLKPTYFMQSTHNTVGSMLGIYTKTHGYNTTYSHGAISFELALQDAVTQMRLDKIHTALVGGYDEMVASYYNLLCKTGFVGVKGMNPCGEVSVSMMLNTEAGAGSLCELVGMTVCHHLSKKRIKQQMETLMSDAELTINDVDAVFTGINGNPNNDRYYEEIAETLFYDIPLVCYKNLFGENYTASAFSVYAASHCLCKDVIPAFMFYRNKLTTGIHPHVILLVNQRERKDFSLILLKKI